MISQKIWILACTAVFLGFFLTVVGPDHYLPFIAMAKARSWLMRKTLVIAFFSGLGHVPSSVMLGFIGLALAAMRGRVTNPGRGNPARLMRAQEIAHSR
jgi:nickel/cobalt exporter